MLGIFSKKVKSQKNQKGIVNRDLEDKIIALSQNGWILQVYQNLFQK